MELNNEELEILLWVLRPFQPSEDWTQNEIARLMMITKRFEREEMRRQKGKRRVKK